MKFGGIVETRCTTSLLCRPFSYPHPIFAASFIHQQLRPTRSRDRIMYTLNFPNGNSQEYKSLSELMNAARKLGGNAKIVGNKTYVFVPK